MKKKDAEVNQIVHQVNLTRNMGITSRIGLVVLACQGVSGTRRLTVLPLNDVGTDPCRFPLTCYSDVELWHATKLEAIAFIRCEVETIRKTNDRCLENTWDRLKQEQKENEEQAVENLQQLDEMEQGEKA
jgi:hypothetical protein